MAQAFDGHLDAELAAQIKAAGLEYGLSIGRRAPLHKMHIDCIYEIARAGLKPVIIIGSVNTAGDPLYDPLRNPLTVEAQMQQLREALPPELYQQCTILTLPDQAEDAVWMQSLQKLLADHGMAGKAVMHFRAKAGDAADMKDKTRCKPLGAYKQSLMDAGIAVWQSYNKNVADDDINASDIRRFDLGALRPEQQAIAPNLLALAAQARAARQNNPDASALNKANVPLTMLDYTWARLYRETGTRTSEIIARAKLTGGVSLDSLTTATKDVIERIKRAPMIISPQYGDDYVSQGFERVTASVGSFQSGETYSELFYGDNDNFEKNADRIKGAHVYVVQSTAAPVGDNVQHLLHMVHTLKYYGAAKVTAVLPFAAYARQDRAFGQRFTSVGADMLPKQLKAAGADAVMSVTLHSKAAMAFYQAAFGKNFKAVSTAPLLAEHLKKLGLSQDAMVIGAPDGGEKLHDEGISRARDVGLALSARFNEAAMFKISKVHTAASETKVTAFSGDVKGKTAVIVDDMVDGGSTLINAARVLKANGAKEVICCVTHGVLSQGDKPADRPALDKILTAKEGDKNLIDRLVMTDSVTPIALWQKMNALSAEQRARVDVLPLAPYLAREMQAQHKNRFAPK